MSPHRPLDTVASSRRFASRLLRVLGLVTAASAALSTTGCGANVVFAEDDEGNGGTSEGGGGAGGEGAGHQGGEGQGGAKPFVCDVDVYDTQRLVYQCLTEDNAVCPEASSSEARNQLSDILAWDACDDLCCDGEGIDAVPCGPDPSVPGECCYYVVVSRYSECMGRPFTIEGEARTASPCARDDWAGVAPTERANRCVHDGTRAHLAEAFTRSALMEHASVASFARFTLDLLALGAPAELLHGAQHAIADEIRHAELCFALASRYAEAPLGPGALDVRSLEHRGRSAEEILADLVREGCIGETLASLVAARASEQATDPEVLAALSTIAEDEAMHAQLAWQTLAWALRQNRSRWNAAILAAFQVDRLVAPEARPPAGVDKSTWSAHGQLDQSEMDAVFEAGWEHVIVACRDAVLGLAVLGLADLGAQAHDQGPRGDAGRLVLADLIDEGSIDEGPLDEAPLQIREPVLA